MVKDGRKSKKAAMKKRADHRKMEKSEIPMVKDGRKSKKAARKKRADHRKMGKSEIPMVKGKKRAKIEQKKSKKQINNTNILSNKACQRLLKR